MVVVAVDSVSVMRENVFQDHVHRLASEVVLQDDPVTELELVLFWDQLDLIITSLNNNKTARRRLWRRRRRMRRRRRRTNKSFNKTTAFVAKCVDEFCDFEGTTTKAEKIANGDVDGEKGTGSSRTSKAMNDHWTAKVVADVFIQLVGHADKVEESRHILGDSHIWPIRVLDMVNDL